MQRIVTSCPVAQIPGGELNQADDDAVVSIDTYVNGSVQFWNLQCTLSYSVSCRPDGTEVSLVDGRIVQVTRMDCEEFKVETGPETVKLPRSP